MSKILVTGAAGFIGFHLSQRLLRDGHRVVGLDNLNAYYEVSLKEARLRELKGWESFQFYQLDLADRPAMTEFFANQDCESVVHLAAQAGVRYSLENPLAYVDSNLVGFMHVLEGCRQMAVNHLVFASSSSVYGANTKIPFSTHDPVDHPLNLYAATKKANELMAHSYSHLYRLPVTGLRFFTVYGPWGRPDMALFLFTRAILAGEPIRVFNYGQMQRDFTYVDDIVEALVRLLPRSPEPDPTWDSAAPNPASSNAPYKLYNIGNYQPVTVIRLIEILETCLGIPAQKQFLPMQPGEVLITYADVDDLFQAVNFRPNTSLEVGVQRFVDWYRAYFQVS